MRSELLPSHQTFISARSNDNYLQLGHLRRPFGKAKSYCWNLLGTISIVSGVELAETLLGQNLALVYLESGSAR